MTTRKAFSFDEEKDAEEIILNGFPTGQVDYVKMYLVTKYFRHKLGFGVVRLEKKIIDFCKENDKTFNPVIEAENIRRWISSAMKYGMRKVDCVSITETEIEKLMKVENVRDRKILFSALVFSKGAKKGSTLIKKDGEKKKTTVHYLNYNNFLDVARLSRLSKISESQVSQILGSYPDYVTFLHPESQLLTVDFADSLVGDVKIEITDFDNIMKYYDETLFVKHKTLVCPRCKTEFTTESNNKIFCNNCSKEIRREKNRKYTQTYRERKGNE